MTCDFLANWDAVFNEPVAPYDIIISDFHNNKALRYSLIQHCNNKTQAENIIKECRSKLHDQYERMMMIRVAKKYNLDEFTRLKIEMEYHNPENYEIKI